MHTLHAHAHTTHTRTHTPHSHTLTHIHTHQTHTHTHTHTCKDTSKLLEFSLYRHEFCDYYLLLVARDPVRVCDRCKERITQFRTPFAGKLINTLDNDSLPTPPTSNGENIEPAILGTPLNYSSNSLNIERSVVEGGGNR